MAEIWILLLLLFFFQKDLASTARIEAGPALPWHAQVRWGSAQHGLGQVMLGHGAHGPAHMVFLFFYFFL